MFTAQSQVAVGLHVIPPSEATCERAPRKSVGHKRQTVFLKNHC